VVQVRREVGGSLSRKPKASTTSTKTTVKKKLKKKPRESGGFMSQIGTVDDDSGVCVVVYGKEGVGKTSLASYFPNPLFVCGPQEHGIHRLVKRKLVPLTEKNIGPDVKTWQDLLDAMEEIANEDHDYQTIVIDSLTELQRLCFKACCDDQFEGDMSKEGFFAFMAGPRIAAQQYWPDFIAHVITLLNNGINVVMTAHTDTKPFNNPEGSDYDRIVADLAGPIWKCTARWAGAVLYYKYEIDVIKEGKKKAKAVGGEDRAICCEHDAAFDGKNSYGLPPYLGPFKSAKDSFDALWKKLNPNQIFKEKRLKT